MRRTLFLAAVLLAVPAQASALPAATEPGITVSHEGGASYLIKFSQSAYQGVAARQFDIACVNATERTGGAGAPVRSVTHLRRLPRHRPDFLRVKPSTGDNVCAFVRGEAADPLDADFLVALDAPGRRWLADFEAASKVQAIVFTARQTGRTAGTWPAYSKLPRAVRQQVAPLASADALPSGKRLGYYSDGGRRAAATAISASGRRMFFSMDGDDATTNTAGVTTVFEPQSAPSGPLPAGPFPAAGTPLPDATVAGVTAAQSGSEVAVSFAGSDAEAAYARLAGHRTVVSCSAAEAPILGILVPHDRTFTMIAPAQTGTLHLNVGAGAVSTCSLGITPGAPVVQVAVGPGGRAPLEDGLGAQALMVVARRAAGSGSGDYASAQSVATAFGGATAVLASPSETPSDRSVGVYSDGHRHLAVVVRTLTGRRLYADWVGETVETNLLAVTRLVPF